MIKVGGLGIKSELSFSENKTEQELRPVVPGMEEIKESSRENANRDLDGSRDELELNN